MKTLTTVLSAAILMTSCSKNPFTKTDYKIKIESSFKTERFITKKEFLEKETQLMKSENNLF